MRPYAGISITGRPFAGVSLLGGRRHPVRTSSGPSLASRTIKANLDRDLAALQDDMDAKTAEYHHARSERALAPVQAQSMALSEEILALRLGVDVQVVRRLSTEAIVAALNPEAR